MGYNGGHTENSVAWLCQWVIHLSDLICAWRQSQASRSLFSFGRQELCEPKFSPVAQNSYLDIFPILTQLFWRRASRRWASISILSLRWAITWAELSKLCAGPGSALT